MPRRNRNLKVIEVVMSLALIFSPCVSLADDPLALTLGEVIRIAGERSARLIVANERVRQAIARIAEETSAFIPQFVGTIAQKRQTRDMRASGLSLPASEEVVGPSNIFDAQVELSQVIFDAATIRRLEAARSNKDWSDAELRKIQQDVFALVATLFVQARSAFQEENFWQSLVERDRKHMEVAKIRSRSGAGSLLAWKQAKADYAESMYRHRMSVTKAEERRLDLLAALGLLPEERVIFSEDDNLPDAELPSSQRIGDLTKDHPDIESALRATEQKKAEYNMEKAGYWPKVSLFADYGSSGVQPDDANNTYALGVQAKVPVFEGGLRQAKIQEAESRLKESEAVTFDTRLNVEAALLGAVEAVREVSALLEAREAAIEVAEEYLAQTRQGAQNGLASALDLADAIAQKESAVYERQAAQAAYVIARINLARAMGDVQLLVRETGRSQ